MQTTKKMQKLFRLLIFKKSAQHISGRQFRPSSGARFDCIYSFWYNAPPLLPTGATVEMELAFHLNRGTGRQQCLCIVPKAVYKSKSAPEDGLIFARNMLGWFLKISKRKICRAFLVVYVVELMTHGHTNIKFTELSVSRERSNLQRRQTFLVIWFSQNSVLFVATNETWPCGCPHPMVAPHNDNLWRYTNYFRRWHPTGNLVILSNFITTLQ